MSVPGTRAPFRQAITLSDDSPTSRRSARVHRWLDRLAQSPNALKVWFAASFAETIIVPIPIELVLVPYMVLNRDKVWRTALTVTIGCLAASLIGYGIGLLFFDTAGRWIIEQFGWATAMGRFRELFSEYGFLAIVAIGVIPIPFQVAMLAAGAAAYPLPLFVAAAAVARGMRYFGLAALVWWLGDAAENFFMKHRRLAGILLSVLFAIILAWMLYKAV